MPTQTSANDARARRREHAVLLTLLTLVVLGPARQMTGALIQRDERKVAVQGSFDETIGEAVRTYQFRGAVQAQRSRRTEELAAREQELQELMAEKTDVRDRIASLQHVIAYLQDDVGVTTQTGAFMAQWERYRVAAAELVHPPLAAPSGLARVFAGEAALDVIHEPVTMLLRERRERATLQAMLVARASAEELVAMRERHTTLLANADTVAGSVEDARRAVARSEADLRHIQAITRDVHDQVLRLQAAMSRIDAQLREKAERALIEKGLLPPQRTSGGEATVAAAPAIQWPVKGWVSAGYRDSGYRQLFGVPHDGIDIAVGTDTPVRSAAEGVVFLVRDGGATGYTYVLIGHRGGMATLYGHLKSVAVATGQDVTAGQVIGATGAPGLPGSGPMMTGPHLHFEVIQNGVNVDPRSVLP
jgi:murein DD-endopeptidase MepM/ murein hydrolase activator NlpD